MSTVLITGVNGFVGKHLVREFVDRNISVIGVAKSEKTASQEISKLLSGYYQVDVTNEAEITTLPLKNIDYVVNLAGLANVGASFDNPELYMDVNVKVLSVLGSALYEASPEARMIAVSTGALYDPNQVMPLTESSQTVIKASPYALSKLAMEKAASALRDNGQDCVVVRPFNHIGPGQGLGFLIPDLANKIKNTNKDSPSISAGNLKTIRDYTDVRDIVKAYADIATSKTLEHSLYNVCSSIGKSGEDIVKALCDQFGIDFNKLTINTDPNLIRPTDPAKIIGSHKNLTQDTGWEPDISLNQTVSDIVANL